MIRKMLAVGAVLMALAGVANAGPTQTRTYTLFAGANTDSTTQVSPWFNIFGAKRVVFKFWSEKAAFHASTDADSTYSDSLVTFSAGFSDSTTGAKVAGWKGDSLNFAEDSLVVDFAIPTQDTAKINLLCQPLPINKELRHNLNGRGLTTVLYPAAPVSSAGPPAMGVDYAGVFTKSLMRVFVTPLRRMTVTGYSSTAGKRVNGLKGFHGRAIVVYDN